MHKQSKWEVKNWKETINTNPKKWKDTIVESRTYVFSYQSHVFNMFM
jgi:hypothetical protein